MSKIKITAPVDYVDGSLRYGQYELEVDKEEWEAIAESDKHEYIRNRNEF